MSAALRRLEALWMGRRASELETAARTARGNSGDIETLARIGFYLASALQFSGRTEEARREYLKCLARLRDSQWRLRAGRGLAQAEIALGRLAAAERSLHRLLPGAPPEDRRKIRGDLASLFRLCGRMAAARRAAQVLGREFRRERDPNNLAVMLNLTAMIDLEEGALVQAARGFAEAHSLFRAAKNRAGESRSAYNEGMAYLLLGLSEEAGSRFHRADRVATRIGLRMDAVRARTGQAICIAAPVRRAEALAGLCRETSTLDPETRAGILLNLAEAWKDAGQIGRAERLLGRLPNGISEASRLESDVLRADLLERTGRKRVAARLLDRVGKDPRRYLPELRIRYRPVEARIWLSQRRIHQALRAYRDALDAVAAIEGRIGPPEIRLLTLGSRRHILEEAVRAALDSGRPAEAFRLLDHSEMLGFAALYGDITYRSAGSRSALRSAREAYAAAALTIRRTRPGPSRSGAPDRIARAERRLIAARLYHLEREMKRGITSRPARATSEGRETTLRFFADQRGVAVNVASGVSSRHLVIPGSERIGSLARDLRLELDFAEGRSREYLRRAGTEEIDTALTDLYRVLLGPIESVLPETDRLVVIPYGDLRNVPFAALRSDEEYLGSSREVVYRSFFSSRAGGRAWNPGPRRALIICGEVSGLDRARSEIEAMRCALKGWEIRSLTGPGLSPDRIASEIAHASLVHFLGHGVARADNPLFSHLVLGGGQRLLLHDLLLPISRSGRGPLVVLAACETLRGGSESGADSLSLASGFLAAGASEVVVSDRRVEDEATALLMADFYGALGSGVKPSTALRQAQSLRIADPATRHPIFWGTWRVVRG